MARMVPDPFPGCEWGEEQVYHALRTLPDQWTVVYDVAFMVQRSSTSLDGQADFVLGRTTIRAPSRYGLERALVLRSPEDLTTSRPLPSWAYRGRLSSG